MDKRNKMNKSFEDNESEKKEITKGIINNIKDKIGEIKLQKERERNIRKNELDFEINQDFVNQFKKNKGKDISTNSNKNEFNSAANEDKDKGIKKNYKNKVNDIKRNNSFDIQESSLSQKNNDTNYNCNNNQTNSNVIVNNNKDVNINTTLFKSRTNQHPLLKGILNKTNDLSRDNSFDAGKKLIIETKKKELKSFLNSSSSSNKIREDSNTFISLQSTTTNQNQSVKHIKNISGTTREKIKDFVFQIEDNKKSKSPFNQNQSSKGVKIPVYNFSSNIPEKKYESCFTQKSLITVKDKEKEKERDDINSLKSFIDFNNNSYKEKKAGLNLEPLSSLSSNNILSYNNNNNTSNSNTSHLSRSQRNKIDNNPIQLNDIIAISNKIRFCSNEEMKNMDRGLINELINLSLVIQKTIAPKNRHRELD